MAIPTIEQVEESGANMDTINEEVKSSSFTLIDQYGDTRKTMAGRQADADEAIRNVGGVDIGDYSSNPLISNAYEYVVFDRSGTPSNWKIKSGVSLDYQIDSATYPTPQQDPNLQAFDDLSKQQADSWYTPTFATVAAMITNANSVDYVDGMPLSVQGENEVATSYIVSNTAGEVDLGGGLYAKRLKLIDYDKPSGDSSARIDWKYDGNVIDITLPTASIREHSILWHPTKRKWYLIADVVELSNPYHPLTYDSDIQLWDSTDLTTWTHLGVCIEKGGSGTGQGEFGVASSSGAAVMDDGTILCPFSSRDSGAPTFATRSIGMAISASDPDTLPWSIQAGFISNETSADDDPSIIREEGTDVYHLFHRGTDFDAAGYRIIHKRTLDPIGGEWELLPDANNIIQYPSVLAQELTAIFQYQGTIHMICMEQISGVGLRDSNAYWVAPNFNAEFQPNDAFSRHLPPAAFGTSKFNMFSAGHFSEIIESGQYKGTSFTTDIDGTQYGVSIELFQLDNSASYFGARCDSGQVIPDGVATPIIYNLDTLVDAQSFDLGGDYDFTNGKFTVPYDGYYEFTAGVRVDSVPQGTQLTTDLTKNGTRIRGLGMDTQANVTAINMFSGGSSGRFFLEKGDEIEVRLLQLSGGPLSISTDPTWQSFSGGIIK